MLSFLGRTFGPLGLERKPLYLRFCLTGNNPLRPDAVDALDQLDDQARTGEYLVAAKWKDRSTVHIDGTRDGKRYGEWRHYENYEACECPLTQKQLADNEQWRAWCHAQQAEGEAP